MSKVAIIYGSAAALVLSSAASMRSAADYVAEQHVAQPPKEVAEAIAKRLGRKAVSVRDSRGNTLCQLWLRTDLPLLKHFSSQTDLNYPLAPGTLVGVVHFPAGWADFREQELSAGTYTIRYAHQPQDGDHLGTSDYRDFLLLCRAKDDTKPDRIEDADELSELSAAAAGSNHPATVYLLPPPKTKRLPSVIHNDEHGYHVLVVETTAKRGDRATKLTLAIVIVGHAI
ncbi:MAG TPA: hypothetical protein EYP14_02550, partial [Planctomycetaceae bacterium]|nr:hypothetical protein [Planctomycetaceae bacterium]